jgi:hypothetical protein
VCPEAPLPVLLAPVVLELAVLKNKLDTARQILVANIVLSLDGVEKAVERRRSPSHR